MYLIRSKSAMTSRSRVAPTILISFVVASALPCLSALVLYTPHIRSCSSPSLSPRQVRLATHVISRRDIGRRQSVLPNTSRVESGLAVRSSGRRSSTIGVAVMMAQNPPGEGKFVKMGGAEDTQSFGPRCVVAGGLSSSALSDLREAVVEEDDAQEAGQSRTPLIVVTRDVADATLEDVLRNATKEPQPADEQAGVEALPLVSPTVLFSGFTNSQVRGVATRFRQLTGVRAAFAKAVPNAMPKTLSRLFGEIAQDHADAVAGRLERPQGS